jgi:hypothetical protein
VAVQKRVRGDRDGDGASPPGELTGRLPVVGTAGGKNGMARTAEAATASSLEAPQTNALRRTRVIVRRLGPWSVFRFAFLYSFSIMLVLYLALAILYTILGAIGVLDTLVKLMITLNIGEKGFRFNGGWIFSRLFVIGVVLVLLWSVIKVISTLIYNLISNIVGGVEVTLAERR